MPTKWRVYSQSDDSVGLSIPFILPAVRAQACTGRSSIRSRSERRNRAYRPLPGAPARRAMQKQTAVTTAPSCSTSPAAVRANPLTTAPVPFRKKARSSRAVFQMPNDRRPFRLRFRDGRSAPAPTPPSLASASLSRSPTRRPKALAKINYCGAVVPEIRIDLLGVRFSVYQFAPPLASSRQTASPSWPKQYEL
jgi:hypothetical protein